MKTPYRESELAVTARAKSLASEVPKPISRRFYGARVGVITGLLVSVGLLSGVNMAPVTLLGLGVGMLVWILRMRKLQLRELARNEEALMLLGAHRLDEAQKLLDLTIKESRAHPGMQMLAVFNRGVVALYRGSFELALAHFQAVESSGWMDKAPMSHYRPLLTQNRAFVYVMVGDLDGAEPLIEKLANELGPIRSMRLVGLRALLLLRKGEYAACRAWLDANLLEAGGMLNLHGYRCVKVYQAFAREHLDEPAERVREEIAGVRPFRVGEFDYLGAHWPELREFLRAHGLLSAEAP